MVKPLISLARENFFDRIGSLAPHNTVFQIVTKKVQDEAAQAHAVSNGLGQLFVGGGGGYIWWWVDSGMGYGRIDSGRIGVGVFHGQQVPKMFQGGTFSLFLPQDGHTVATLVFITSDKPVFTYHGSGYQEGLRTYWGNPWKGDWN
jgi:hypothetical protein